MISNINIGLLGHVDSGKTTLARTLSTISSTAAFDKNPQSQARGITLDLGFSGVIVDAPNDSSELNTAEEAKKLQLTFVDCPGHASLIRTIIGGAQIIDLMLLVIDAQKGIQTQTAECIVIGELLQKDLIVVVNKIDLIDEDVREKHLTKLITKIRKTLTGTAFGENVPIYSISALQDFNVKELLNGIIKACDNNRPQRLSQNEPFLMYVDHCFNIKGQGTICTGTIVQGKVSVHNVVEFPSLCEQRKVKSIQIFRHSVKSASMGDRVGICVTQLNAKLLERGILSQPGYLKPCYAICVRLRRIPYYKNPIKSNSKFHVSIGHDTVMAKIIMFRSDKTSSAFNFTDEYEYLEEVEEISANDMIYALLELEVPVWATKDSTIIASKLDMDIHSKSCRLAFWGKIEWQTHNQNYISDCLTQWRVFRYKRKQGNINRVVNENEVIVKNLFSKLADRSVYIGKTVKLTTGEIGIIDSSFGQSSKVRISMRDSLAAKTLELLKSKQASTVRVHLVCKKYIFNKKLGLSQ